jgi:hypothetical protein
MPTLERGERFQVARGSYHVLRRSGQQSVTGTFHVTVKPAIVVGGPRNSWVPHSIVLSAIEWGHDAADTLSIFLSDRVYRSWFLKGGIPGWSRLSLKRNHLTEPSPALTPRTRAKPQSSDGWPTQLRVTMLPMLSVCFYPGPGAPPLVSQRWNSSLVSASLRKRNHLPCHPLHPARKGKPRLRLPENQPDLIHENKESAPPERSPMHLVRRPQIVSHQDE